MDSRHGKMRMNAEGDRISSLPDDLIHKILSYIDIRDAIGTSFLSSRWRFIWTSLPYLNLSIDDFSSLPKFSKFVTNVLYRRDILADVYSLKLRLRVKTSQVFVKRILDYAFFHNIQQLDVVCLLENDIEFPLSLFSSQSLSVFSSQSIKHLSLKTINNRKNRRGYADDYFITLTSTWNLPTLTTLDLHFVSLPDDNVEECVGVFSECTNLKNLTLNNFKSVGSNSFSIFHPRLSNLTLEKSHYDVTVVNVVAPQLKNLTIRFCSADHVISAPELESLIYKGHLPLHLSTEGFLSLEKADVCVCSPRDTDAHKIFCLLQQLYNVKFLTLNLEIVECLSSSEDLILQQPSPFVNLKSLKIYPEKLYWLPPTSNKVDMSNEVKSYLLDSSLGITLTMVLREEVRAQNLMDELRVLLKKEKDNSIANTSREREKTHEENKLTFGENMEQIKSCWEHLIVQLQQRKEKACYFISKLQNIEQLLTKLPASKRAEIQPSFSSLFAEAYIAITKLTDSMKIQCDENQSHFHELAITLESSF